MQDALQSERYSTNESDEDRGLAETGQRQTADAYPFTNFLARIAFRRILITSRGSEHTNLESTLDELPRGVVHVLTHGGGIGRIDLREYQ
jgi:hypothetical protein